MLRVNFLSFGRAKDAGDRRYRLLRAICQAEEAGATVSSFLRRKLHVFTRMFPQALH